PSDAGRVARSGPPRVQTNGRPLLPGSRPFPCADAKVRAIVIAGLARCKPVEAESGDPRREGDRPGGDALMSLLRFSSLMAEGRGLGAGGPDGAASSRWLR